MDLLLLVLVYVLIGFVVLLLTTRVPMPPYWAKTIQVGVLILIVLHFITRVVTIPNVLR